MRMAKRGDWIKWRMEKGFYVETNSGGQG